MWSKLYILMIFMVFPNFYTFADNNAAFRMEGGNIIYYTSIHDAFEAASALAVAPGSTFTIENPDEITLLTDVTIQEPLIVTEGVHIRLVAGGGDRTIMRGNELLDFPVIWVRGDSASLTLGRPGTGMQHELIIDGGYRSDTPVIANSPTAAVSGPDSRLIMYDNVIIQNNNNSGRPPGITFYEHGGGVFIRTEGDHQERLAEFIMRGGVIQGNVNNVQTDVSSGGGVLLAGFGLFTMEGGEIRNNTARRAGGGVNAGSRASFRKTGGIIYGSNAPGGLRNTAGGAGTQPNIYGHAVNVFLPGNPIAQYRNNTVGENDNLSYIGHPNERGIFGEGERWDSLESEFQRRLLIIIPAALVLSVFVFIIVIKITKKRRMKALSLQGMTVTESIDKAKLTEHEKKVFELLLTALPIKQIADRLEITYDGVMFHSRKIYRKYNVRNRTELLASYQKK